MPDVRKRLITAADGRQYVVVGDGTALSLGTVKAYMLMSDGHYYRMEGDPTGTGSLVMDDIGATAPTSDDALLIDGVP